ncbi:MAG: flippase [Nanoarchaeota archaeon]|nr:flippase [Nanoarchaeota archaeon]
MIKMKKGNKINKFDVESNLKLIAKTSLIVFVGIFISKILAYIFRITIARYYGPEVYGLFSLATMIFGMTITFSLLGLTSGLARFIPQYRGKNESNQLSYLFRFTKKVLLITSVISALFLFFLSEFIAVNIFHNIDLIIWIKILSFFVPIAILSGIFLEAIKSYELISYHSFIFNILQNVMRVLILAILILLGFNAPSAIVSYCLGFLAVLIASYAVCRYKIPGLFLKSKLSKKCKLKVRKGFLSYSIPLLFLGIVSIIFYWVDSFFLGYFKGAEAVGFYNAAVPIALLLAIIPEIFMQLFFPMINRHYSKNNFELINQLSKQIGKWIFMVNLPIFILIFIFPGAAINILFGSQYLIAENALRILIFGSFIASIGIISNNLLSMIGKSKLILVDIIIASIMNIILNVLLIPLPSILGIDNSLGINGAAIATTISVVSLSLLFFFQAKKNIGIIPMRLKMIKLFIIGIIPGVVLFYLRAFFPSQNLLFVALLVLSFLAVNAILTLVSNSLDENDIIIINAIWRRISRCPKKSKF